MIERQEAKVFIQSNGIDELNGVTVDEVRQELLGQLLRRSNVERMVILKDSVKKLSAEAREVIRIILNSPEEMVEYLWGMEEKQITKITQRDLRQYLNWSLGWPFLVIEEVFGELKRFVKNF
ncbi:hypothetical protein KKF82_05825 [Patescibacteria group bacterium]|uniref:Uncharacterized protein n=1 Tax=viral metagenome TaxID=1070528 RepID=A0A6M3MD19_9ZZZZ|nr:hypothetical protein [Patescibacteria group bacterium]